MAAPHKTGLDYFSHDVNLSSDDRIEYLEAMHGLIGYAIYLKILEKTYREGYYLKWDEKKVAVWAKKWGVDLDKLNAILELCLDEGLFDKSKFQIHDIVTSKSIQTRYLKGSIRRKKIVFNKCYLLMDRNTIIANINNINVDINEVNVNGNSQIEIESKGKEKRNEDQTFYTLNPTIIQDQILLEMADNDSGLKQLTKSEYDAYYKRLTNLKSLGLTTITEAWKNFVNDDWWCDRGQNTAYYFFAMKDDLMAAKNRINKYYKNQQKQDDDIPVSL